MPALPLHGGTVSIYQTADPVGYVSQFPISDLSYGMARCGRTTVGFDATYGEPASIWLNRIRDECFLDDFADTRTYVELELMFGWGKKITVMSEQEKLLKVINADTLEPEVNFVAGEENEGYLVEPYGTSLLGDSDESPLEKLKRAISQFLKYVKDKASEAQTKTRELEIQIRQWVKEQDWPIIFGWVLVALGVAILLWFFILSPLGFGALGVVGGSVAAVVQSTFHGAAVTAGSCFSIA